MERITLKERFIEACHLMGAKEWFPGSSGNVSVLDPDKKWVYIKSSGCRMVNLKSDEVNTLDLSGNILEGEGKPSKEINFHLGIYRVRKDVTAVIHNHSPYATSFAIAGKEFPLLTPPAKIVIKKVPLVEYAPPGSTDLAEMVIKEFSDPSIKSILLKDHGTVSVGKDLEDAIKISEWLEDAAFHSYLSIQMKKPVN